MSVDKSWADTIILCVSGIVAFGVSIWLTPLLRNWAVARGWVVPPSPRRVHTNPTPRIGGLAIYLSFVFATLAGITISFLLIATGLFKGQFWLGDDLWRIILLLLGSVPIALISAIDDIRELSPLPRLLSHFLGAAIIVVPQVIYPTGRPGVLIDIINSPFGGIIRLGDIPLLALIITLVWIVGMMNTINWIDGLDGLSGGIVLIAAIMLFLENLLGGRTAEHGYQWQFTSALIAVVLAASVAGFLPFNWHPASIFMGDSGAMFLGFALGVLSIIDGAKLATVLLVVGLPVMDAIWVVLYRLYNRRNAGKADKSHIHHRLLEMGYSQRQIVLFFYALTIIFGLVGIMPITQEPWIKFLALVVLVILLLPIILYSVYYRPRNRKSNHQEQKQDL
ncbi:MraY family glycosyltransferase [Candidatus Chlorohelix sp.]|uniref:glycosyltransferase family 4 protein n=1 Tax=Candidatus Chlorohelix sp. TaxID=3139201 RepID=UPI003022A751